MKDLIDPQEPCRMCNGKGEWSERDTYRGVTTFGTCWDCRGTGNRTVRITTAPQAPHLKKGKENV